MKNKYIMIMLSCSIMLGGCQTVQEASSAMGSTGTGIIAGAAAGAGTGILCDKMTKGKKKGECIAAGMAVGAAVGAWAASLDEELEKAEPVMDCKSLKKRMNYSQSETKPRAEIKLVSFEPGTVVKPGETIKPKLTLNLVSPEDQQTDIKLVLNTQGTKVHSKECGGNIPLNPAFKASDTLGAENVHIEVIDAKDENRVLAQLDTCFTVANDGVDVCGKTTTKGKSKGKKSSSKKKKK